MRIGNAIVLVAAVLSFTSPSLATFPLAIAQTPTPTPPVGA
jgi:hypothetical protein